MVGYTIGGKIKVYSFVLLEGERKELSSWQKLKHLVFGPNVKPFRIKKGFDYYAMEISDKALSMPERDFLTTILAEDPTLGVKSPYKFIVTPIKREESTINIPLSGSLIDVFPSVKSALANGITIRATDILNVDRNASITQVEEARKKLHAQWEPISKDISRMDYAQFARKVLKGVDAAYDLLTRKIQINEAQAKLAESEKKFGEYTKCNFNKTGTPKAECQNLHKKKVTPMKTEKALFAGGCFWCIEAGFSLVPGVIKATAGYTGGTIENPTYEQVTSGKTGHREAVEITYDPEKVSYEKLLDIFLKQIDPTDSAGQFADRGFQYTTAIYYFNKEQKEQAQKAKRNLENSDKFDKPIVTEILAAKPFYPAEEHHQKFFQKQPMHYDAYSQASGRKAFIEKKWGNKSQNKNK